MGKPRQKFALLKGNLEEQESRVVRPELNLEQWDALFAPSQARGKTNKVRILERHSCTSEGLELTETLEIGFSNYGGLTTAEQKVLYGLVRVWEKRQKPLSYCYLSRYELAKELGLMWGDIVDEYLTLALYRLRTAPLKLNCLFYNAETNEEEKLETTITILSALTLRTRRKKEDGKYEVTSEQGYFSFDPMILKNLAKGFTRPVLLDVVLSLKTGIGQLIYNLADRQLSTKPEYNIGSETLFRELGITGRDYRYLSARIRTLKKPLTELEGRPLSSGGVLKVTVKPTKDSKDQLLIFAKRARIASPKNKPPKDKPSAPPPEQNSTLTQRLYEELGISLTVARTLEASHPERAFNWCEAKKHSQEMKDKGAGFFVRAILEGWEFPGDYKEIKARSDRRASEEREHRINRAKEAHYERFSKEYLFFAADELHRISQAHPEAFRKFEEQASEEQKKYENFGLATFHIEQARVTLAEWFFNDGYWSNYQIPFTGFWEWDEKHNLEPFRFVE
jgi:hypothetical protein